METVTIQGFTAYPANMTPKTTPASPTPGTTTPETYPSTIAIGSAYPKTGMILNTGITNDFRIANVTEFVTPITTRVGIPMILRYPAYLAAGFPNSKASVDPAVKICLET